MHCDGKNCQIKDCWQTCLQIIHVPDNIVIDMMLNTLLASAYSPTAGVLNENLQKSALKSFRFV